LAQLDNDTTVITGISPKSNNSWFSKCVIYSTVPGAGGEKQALRPFSGV